MASEEAEVDLRQRRLATAISALGGSNEYINTLVA
jgi:hypothetical protein